MRPKYKITILILIHQAPDMTGVLEKCAPTINRMMRRVNDLEFAITCRLDCFRKNSRRGTGIVLINNWKAKGHNPARRKSPIFFEVTQSTFRTRKNPPRIPLRIKAKGPCGQFTCFISKIDAIGDVYKLRVTQKVCHSILIGAIIIVGAR